MKNSVISVVLSFLLILCFASIPLRADTESVLGKWLGKAETPHGPVEMEFELKQEAGQLVGSAVIMQGTIPLSAVKFEEPNLAFELSYGGSGYKLMGTLKDGKLAGTWEQLGGDMKGTWNAERKPAVATATSAATGIAGSWSTVSVTPNGELALVLDLKQEGERINGVLSSEMGTAPIQSARFKENKLQFEVDFGGTVYRVEGSLKENKIEGKWYPVAGGEGGAWSATRNSPGPAPAGATPPPAAASVRIDGIWSSIAVTPGGDLPFQIVFKQTDGVLSGQIVSSDGTLPLQKLSFLDNKLSFEVDYMGATYRIDAILANNKFTGKWSAVAGSDTGAWSAVQKP